MACSGMLYMQKANYHFSACVQDPNDALQLSGDEGSEPDGGVAAPVPSGDTAAVAGALAMLASSEPAEAAPAEDVSWMAKRRHTVENDPEHRQFLLDVLQMAGGGGAPPAAVAASPHAGELVQLAQVRSTFTVRALRVWHVWCSGSELARRSVRAYVLAPESAAACGSDASCCRNHQDSQSQSRDMAVSRCNPRRVQNEGRLWHSRLMNVAVNV